MKGAELHTRVIVPTPIAQSTLLHVIKDFAVQFLLSAAIQCMKPLHYRSPGLGTNSLRINCLKAYRSGYIAVGHRVPYQAIQTNSTPGTLTIRSRSGKMVLPAFKFV
jgi:hypothetical protein